MSNWFECKVKYEKVMENGLQKAVIDPYLVDALSFTEAEKRIIEEMEPFIRGEFSVEDIRKSKIAEIFNSTKEEDDKWYKCKLSFITINENTKKEKKTTNIILVKAINLKVAYKNVEEGMKNSMIDYDVVSITETSIIDVFPYKVPTK